MCVLLLSIELFCCVGNDRGHEFVSQGLCYLDVFHDSFAACLIRALIDILTKENCDWFNLIDTKK